MRPPEVRIEYEGPVARLVVDRPAARNALAPSTMDAFEAAVAELERAIRRADGPAAVVLHGGGQCFVSGGDLQGLAHLREVDVAAAMARQMQRVLSRLEALPVPVIAAIDGYAIGGGAEVAVAADLRVFATDAFIGFRQQRFAVSTAWGGARRLAALVGPSRARALLWSTRDVWAAEAMTLGLADRVAAPGATAVETAVAWAHTLAAQPRGATSANKKLVAEAVALSANDHAELEARVFSETWVADDHWRALEAYWRDRAVRRRRRAGPSLDVVHREASGDSESAAPGRFIVLEGLDGAGTTTQARLLVQWLRRRGCEVHPTAEPSGGPVGNLLRQSLRQRVVEPGGRRLAPQAIALMFAADRADHLRSEIEPALASGADVICDRYVHSSIAYQGAEGDVAWVAALNSPMRRPDLVIYVRVSVETAAKRRGARGTVQEIYEFDAYQRRVLTLYEDMSRYRPDDRVVVVDGDADVRDVQRACRAAIGTIDGEN